MRSIISSLQANDVSKYLYKSCKNYSNIMNCLFCGLVNAIYYMYINEQKYMYTTYFSENQMLLERQKTLIVSHGHRFASSSTLIIVCLPLVHSSFIFSQVPKLLYPWLLFLLVIHAQKLRIFGGSIYALVEYFFCLF